MRPSHPTSLRHLVFAASVFFSICLSSGAAAQCDGTELVVHTFTSFANAELAWELVDASGSTLSTYAWQGNAVNTYDSLCFAEPCPFMITQNNRRHAATRLLSLLSY